MGSSLSIHQALNSKTISKIKHCFSFSKMEKSSPISRQSAFPVFALFAIFLFDRIAIGVKRICRFLSRFCSHLHLKTQFVVLEEEKKNPDLDSSIKEKRGGNICREDVEFVMGKLGFSCSQESEELQNWFSSKDLAGLFDEKEPALEEVKEAFGVFDFNRDGFIDELELQSVICNLGFGEGGELENCRKIIRIYDKNGDGRIDFSEFVEFMESSFC